jgi:hypothetical protein
VIYLLDADLNGDDSVRHLVLAGKVKYVPMTNHEAFESVVTKLLPLVYRERNESGNFLCKPEELDTVILDSAPAMAELMRWDSKFGSDPTKTILDKRKLYLGGDANFLTVYNWTTDAIMTRLKNLRAAGARVITTSHTDESVDPASLTKKMSPDMNDALRKSMMRACSDVFRMYELFDPIVNKTTGEVSVPAGFRILQLAKNDEAVAKYHVTDEYATKIPKEITVPPTGGLHKLYVVLGKRPSWLHLYGAEGVGKTTFACSEADPVPVPVTRTKKKEEVA